MVAERLFLLLFTAVLFSNNSCTSQSSDSTQWAVVLTTGLEAHDKRLGTLPQRDFLLQTQQELFGTYSLAVSLQRQRESRDKFLINYGLDLIYSRATFRRPYVNASSDLLQSDIIQFVDNYRELMFAPTIGVQR